MQLKNRLKRGAYVNPDYVKELADETTKLQGDIAKQLPRPQSGIAVGKYFRVAAIDEAGNPVLEAVDLPLVTSSSAGVCRTNANSGTSYTANGTITTVRATDSEIDAKSNNYKPIVPSNADRAIRAGLLSNSQITDADKPKICQTIGAQTREGIQLIRSVTLEEPAKSIQINTTSDGQPFNALDFCVLVSIPQITGTKSYLNAQWRSVQKRYYQNFPTAYVLDPARSIQALYAMEYFANRMIPRLFYGRPRGTCENPSAFGILDEISPINGVWFSQYNASSELIPAGTTFELYGRLV